MTDISFFLLIELFIWGIEVAWLIFNVYTKYINNKNKGVVSKLWVGYGFL